MTTLVADGMATWWIRPLWSAVGGYLFGSVVASNGKVCAVKVDISDLSVTTFDLGTPGEDDHNAACVVASVDKPPLYFWSEHNAEVYLHRRVGDGEPDELSFSSGTLLTFAGSVSYAQAWRRPGTDEVHVFVRDANRYWSHRYSTGLSGWGADFVAARRILDFGAGGDLYYIATQAVASDPSVLRFAAYGHPGSELHDIRVGLIDLASGDITQLDGTVLGNLKDGTNLPLGFTDLDLVWDSPAGHTTRMYDVGDGSPFTVAFSDWVAGEGAPDSTYKVAVYDGESWAISTVVDSGAPFYDAGGDRVYFGGVTIPPGDDGTMLYLSREDSGTWYIERWIKDGTWSGTTLASDASDYLVRPWVPSRHLSVPVLWHRATSYADIDFTASLESDRVLPSALAGAASAWPSLKP